MATFVGVVRSGSFASASRLLQLPKSTVSQHVSRLEATLGARLLERTTRALRLTNAGAAYYERCVRILTEVEEANAAVKDLGTSPRGTLRVATSYLIGQSVVADVAATFCRQFPEIEIDVVASDRRVNLLEEGFDIAIVVAGTVPDTTMISRVLSGGRTWCCATPSYLAESGTPLTPAELGRHECIVRAAATDGAARETIWTFERADDVRRVEVHGRLHVNSVLMAHAAVLAGAGIATIPSFICANEVESGRLVHILSDWIVDRKEIRIVYPSNRHLSPRVKLFADAFVREYTARFCA